MEKWHDYKKVFLVASVLSNICILFLFKYYDFFVTELNQAFGTNWVLFNLILPVGLSFHTFQSLSYVFEVYHGRYKAEKHLGYFALFVMYFPQLVAGPIEPPQNLLNQLKVRKPFLWQNILNGSRLILWGLFKKAVIADRISFYVNGIFENPVQFHSSQVLLAVVFFTIQIYCDFSGYSDMAVGISKCFGINLTFNFNRPFFSSNIKEFWGKWHVSLSNWFKIYLFIPLGGNKHGYLKNCLLIVLIFFISGIWHGAGYNYILWGVSNASFVIFFIGYKKYFVQKRRTNLVFKFLGVILTFIVICITFIFFRAHNLEQITGVFTKLIYFSGEIKLGVAVKGFSYGTMNLSFLALMILFLLVVEFFTAPDLSFFQKKPWLDIWFINLLILLIIFTGIFFNQNFIYFQF